MIKDNLIQQGRVLFKYRGYVPFAIIPLVFLYLPALKYKSMTTTTTLIWVGIAVALVGLVLRAINVGYTPRNTSGRNTAQQKADYLNTTGMYSIVRHPLYLFNFIEFIGFLLPMQSITLIIITTVLYYFYYERITLAEEDFLEEKYGEPYRIWTKKVHAFIPNFTKWQKPNQDFHLLKAIRREGPGLLLIAAVFPIQSFIIARVMGTSTIVEWVYANSILLVFSVLGMLGYLIPKMIWKQFD